MSNSRSVVARWHRPLTWLAALMGLLTIVALVGLVLDDRRRPNWTGAARPG